MFAAFLALKGNIETIKHAKQQEENRESNSFLAAQAMLPLVLSELHKISEYYISAHMKGINNIASAKQMKFSDASLSILQKCIRHGQPDLRNYLFEIIASYQILIARFDSGKVIEDLRDNKTSRLERIDRSRAILEWLAFQKLVDNLFRFARRETEAIDRSVVFEKTMDGAEFLSFEGGDALENIIEFREQLAFVKDKQFLQVASEDWRMVINRLRNA